VRGVAVVVEAKRVEQRVEGAEARQQLLAVRVGAVEARRHLSVLRARGHVHGSVAGEGGAHEERAKGEGLHGGGEGRGGAAIQHERVRLNSSCNVVVIVL
jgi:hypothetical protein